MAGDTRSYAEICPYPKLSWDTLRSTHSVFAVIVHIRWRPSILLTSIESVYCNVCGGFKNYSTIKGLNVITARI